MDFHKIWLLWFILAAVFAVGEIFTAGFFLLCFGIGASVAGFIAMVGGNPVIQWVVFLIVSGVAVAMSRKFADKITDPQPAGVGANRFVGKTGTVIETVDPAKNTGMVKMDQEQWRAASEDGKPIASGTCIETVRVEGTRLIVKIKEGR